MLEDPFRTDSWEQWRSGRQQLPNTQFMADRAVSLSDTALVAAATSDAIHGVVVNMDLAPTLSDAVRFAVRAKGAGLDRLVAAATDSTDPVAVDVAVAIGAEYIRLGTTSRFEHVGQYNRLNELAVSLGL
jgi:enolase